MSVWNTWAGSASTSIHFISTVNTETVPNAINTQTPMFLTVLVAGSDEEGRISPDLSLFEWGGSLVDESQGKTTTPCPILHFLPDENHAVEQDVYVCPCYKTAKRSGTLGTSGISTNFVLAIELPSDMPKDYWVLRGAALVCSDDSE